MKFRVWDKTYKQYEKLRWGFDKDGSVVVWDGYEQCFVKNYGRYIIEQFTGTYDNRGNPIYEGDIIKHGCATQYYESVVFYKPKACSFLAANFYYKYSTSFKVSDETWAEMWPKKGLDAYLEGFYRTDMRFSDEPMLEVIGNINENPEIL